MRNFEKINELRFWSQKVLPLVYDDSISYYETLCKIVKTINALITNVNELPNEIAELISDEKLKEILGLLLNQLEEQIAMANEGTSTTATSPRKIGELVWLNGKLYKIINNMIAGDQYIENSNCKKVTIEDLIKNTYYPSQELLEMNIIVDGEAEKTVGDVHVYQPEFSTIKIEEA